MSITSIRPLCRSCIISSRTERPSWSACGFASSSSQGYSLSSVPDEKQSDSFDQYAGELQRRRRKADAKRRQRVCALRPKSIVVDVLGHRLRRPLDRNCEGRCVDGATKIYRKLMMQEKVARDHQHSLRLGRVGLGLHLEEMEAMVEMCIWRLHRILLRSLVSASA